MDVVIPDTPSNSVRPAQSPLRAGRQLKPQSGSLPTNRQFRQLPAASAKNPSKSLTARGFSCN
jgi:hypothetical protein